MAKQKESVNKSAAIRELLKQNPKMATKDIISTLAQQGIEVKPGIVYFIKGRMKKGKGRKARAKAEASTDNIKAVKSDPVGIIRKVKNLASEVSGMAKLRALLEALAE